MKNKIVRIFYSKKADQITNFCKNIACIAICFVTLLCGACTCQLIIQGQCELQTIRAVIKLAQYTWILYVPLLRVDLTDTTALDSLHKIIIKTFVFLLTNYLYFL